MAKKIENECWSSISESTLIQNFPLHRACRDGDIAQLSKLLQQKDSADFHMSLEDTYYGWTPLHWAAYFGKPECLRVLIKFSKPGTTELKTSRFNQTPSHIAAFAGHLQCLQLFIQAGADINVKDYLGETPLHKASRSGSEECVALLVNNKALTRVKNDNDKTAAELAHSCHHISAANFLLNVQKQESFASPLVSSNGYYGYQLIITESPTRTRSAPACDLSMEMETEDALPISNGSNGLNGHHHQSTPAAMPPQGVLNGSQNGRMNGFRNGVVRSPSALNGDITLSEDVLQNRIPIAGKKRSREETVCPPQMKRIRIEGPVPVNNNRMVGVPPCLMSECSMKEHFDSVVVERGYESIKFHMLMADVHGC